MKKIITLILTITAFLRLCIPAHAAENYYYVPEYNMMYCIPDGFDVLTRDTPANSPLFSKYGTTYEHNLADMIATDKYCFAISKDNSFGMSLMIYSQALDVPDYNKLSDQELQKYIDLYKQMYTDKGSIVNKRYVYNSPQMKYVCIETREPNNWYGLRYNCYYKGHNYELTVITYGRTANHLEQQALKNFVDSCYIQSFSYRNPMAADTPEFTYQSNNGLVNFTVPAGWQMNTNYTAVDEYTEARFVYPTDNFVTMTFGSFDAYATMDSAFKSIYSREDCDISVVDEIELLKDFMVDFPEGLSAKEIRRKYYMGTEYLVLEYDATIPGIDMVHHLTAMFTIEDGMVHIFTLYGSDNSRYFTDFETMLRSAEYSSGILVKDASFMPAICVGATVILLTLALFNKKAKKATPAPTTPTPLAIPQPKTTAPQIKFCHRCGTPIQGGDVFCINCGTKLHTVNDIYAVKSVKLHSNQQNQQPKR